MFVFQTLFYEQDFALQVAQVCAYELGIPLSKVCIRSNNTLVNSNSVTTGGSVTSELCCKVCRYYTYMFS